MEDIPGKLHAAPDALSRRPDLVSHFKRIQFTGSDIIQRIKEETVMKSCQEQFSHIFMIKKIAVQNQIRTFQASFVSRSTVLGKSRAKQDLCSKQ